MKGKHFLCRTAASFVSARIGIKPKVPISPRDIGVHKERNGGLIVVGSYVPKTTKQVSQCFFLLFFQLFVHVRSYMVENFFQVEELKSRCSHILKNIEVV